MNTGIYKSTYFEIVCSIKKIEIGVVTSGAESHKFMWSKIKLITHPPTPII